MQASLWNTHAALFPAYLSAWQRKQKDLRDDLEFCNLLPGQTLETFGDGGFRGGGQMLPCFVVALQTLRLQPVWKV